MICLPFFKEVANISAQSKGEWGQARIVCHREGRTKWQETDEWNSSSSVTNFELVQTLENDELEVTAALQEGGTRALSPTSRLLPTRGSLVAIRKISKISKI